MKIYLRHRLVALIVAFLAAVGMAAELDAGVWYSSFVREAGRTEQSLMVSVINTPNGFISSGRMHYYIKDYQGNVRQVTDADGVEVKYGTKGSARLDVVVFDKDGNIVHIFDIKTGNAKLTEAQIRKIQKHSDTTAPVTEIHIQ